MKLIFHFRTLVLLLSFTLSQLSLKAQTNTVVLKIQHTATKLCDTDSGITYLTYYIRPNILRIDLNGPYANSSFIFQPSSERIWVLYHHEKVFYSMAKVDVDIANAEIKRAADEFKKKMEAQNPKGDEKSATMWANGLPLQSENLEFVQKKKQDSLISFLMCKKYEAVRSNGSNSVMFLNNLKTTGIKDDELQILTQFADFMGEGTRILAGTLDFTSFRKRSQNAYPVLIENKSNNQVCNQLILKLMYRDNSDDDFYKVPVHFGKLQNPLGHSR